MNPPPRIYWICILPVALIKLVTHLLTNANYGFHRDALLYLALGRHPDLGHWSNPPMIGWISFLIQQTLGDSVFAVRLIPALLGTGLVVLAALMAREMRGGAFAQFLAAFVVFASPAYLRTSWLFQPVVVDVFFWTLYTWLLLRFLNTRDRRYFLYFGAALGLGLLNKYSVGFFAAGVLLAFLATPLRKQLWHSSTLWAAGIAFVLFLPNLIWQYQHHFPVILHFQGLARYQLVNVSPVFFLLDQLLANLPGLLIWLPGLIFLLVSPKSKPYRSLAWLYLIILVLFLLLRGKSYYTLGLYPVLMAAGAVAWEFWTKRPAARLALPALILLLLLPILPFGLPILKMDKMVHYCDWMVKTIGLDAPMRWEDGEVYPLPQDYADMIGWEELAGIVAQAYAQAPDKERCMIYAENYGQAGAIDRFGKKFGLPPAVSFSDTYRIWAPDHTNTNTLVYVNDQPGEDVRNLFSDITLIGQLEHPYARESGVKVFLCSEPRHDVDSLWSRRAAEVKSTFRH